MSLYQERVSEFLSGKTIAIAGYSTQAGQPANAIYDRFQEKGYHVLAVNPKAEVINEVPCYQSLKDLPQQPDGVVICTPPTATKGVLEECHQLGIDLVWIHRSFIDASYDPAAEAYARENGMKLIAGGCPLMHLDPDFGHQCIRLIAKWQGKLKGM